MREALRSDRLLLGLLLAIFVAVDAQMVREVVRVQPLGVDYLAIWTGVRFTWLEPVHAYDFVAVTDAQRWAIGDAGSVRPFVYPPTVGLMFRPLGLIGYWPSYVLFVAATLALFLGATWRAFRSRTTVLFLLLSPVVVLAVLSGQVTLLVGALIMLAIRCSARPEIAGVLWATVAAIKPQFVLLLPVALLLQGQWVTLLVTTGVVACLVLLSAWIFGFAVWDAWIAALPRFTEVVNAPGFLPWMVTPYSALVRAGVSGALLNLSQLAFALLGLAVVVWAFHRPRSAIHQTVALVGAALVASPYAMEYELALLAPAALAPQFLLQERPAGVRLVLVGCLLLVFPGPAALAVLLTALLLLTVRAPDLGRPTERSRRATTDRRAQ